MPKDTNVDDILDEFDQGEEAAGAEADSGQAGEGEASDMALWEQALAEQDAATATAATDTSNAAAAPAPKAAKSKKRPETPVATTPASFQNLYPDQGAPGNPNNIDLILDIPVNLSVELGRTKIQIRNLLQLAQGSVVELDRLAGEPMDVLVNGTLIAQGEVVVVNEKFGIRLTDIVSPSERVKKLR